MVDRGRIDRPQMDIPPHVAETVQAIALLHAEHHRKSTLPERIVDRATASVGRPRFLLALLATATAWVLFNLALLHKGFPPPFSWMELVLTGAALLIAIMILASQGARTDLRICANRCPWKPLCLLSKRPEK